MGCVCFSGPACRSFGMRRVGTEKTDLSVKRFDFIGGKKLDGSVSVSYTHLDVYKRQMYSCQLRAARHHGHFQQYGAGYGAPVADGVLRQAVFQYRPAPQNKLCKACLLYTSVVEPSALNEHGNRFPCAAFCPVAAQPETVFTGMGQHFTEMCIRDRGIKDSSK